MLTIIVAYDKNSGIGFMGGIPWHLPEDMAHFKKTTLGHAVILGRKTWESLPERFKPLPGRTNIVVGKTLESLAGAICCKSIQDAKNKAAELHLGEEVFLIGGGQMYRSYLEKGWVDRVLASEIFETYPADTYFPKLSDEWAGKELAKYERFRVMEYTRSKP